MDDFRYVLSDPDRLDFRVHRAAMVDPAVLEREMRRIFDVCWIYAGHESEVREPGDFVTRTICGRPILLCRAAGGAIRVFLNVCRHRGAVLVEGRGSRETLQCRYHAWTYDLEGRLRTAPRADREPGLDTEGICLLELPVEAWGPMVFVNPDPEASPLAETLGPVPGHFAGGGIDLDGLRFYRRTDLEVACNWKIAVENYLECYHCAIAHPGFSAVVDVRPDAYRLETYALASSQFGPTKGEPSGPVEGQFHWLWPVTKVYALPGPQNLVAGPLVPLDAGRTAGWFDYFFAEDVSEEQAEELIAFDDQVGLEDRQLVESVQRGVGSGLLEGGQLMPESEQLLAHFQGLVREALA